MSVLYKDAGNAVDGSGDDVFIVKADVLGVRFDGVVEVCTGSRAQAEVPLCPLLQLRSLLPEHIGHSDAGGIDDEFGIAREQCRYSSVSRDTCLSAGRSGKGVLVEEVA